MSKGCTRNSDRCFAPRTSFQTLNEGNIACGVSRYRKQWTKHIYTKTAAVLPKERKVDHILNVLSLSESSPLLTWKHQISVHYIPPYTDDDSAIGRVVDVADEVCGRRLCAFCAHSFSLALMASMMLSTVRLTPSGDSYSCKSAAEHKTPEYPNNVIKEVGSYVSLEFMTYLLNVVDKK